MSARTIEDLRLKQSLPLNVKISLTRERIRQWVDEFGEDGVYVSFSGGKDSTVLLDIVRNVCNYKRIPAVFVDVPTQYPELRQFAKTIENVEIIKPKISFMEVCEQYGFPMISKEVSQIVDESRSFLAKGKEIPKYRLERLKGERIDPKTGQASRYNISQYSFLVEAPFEVSKKCCNVMKKNPIHLYEKQTGRKPMLAQMADESFLRQQKWLQNGCNAFDVKRPVSNPMSFWTENDVLQYVVKNDLKICLVYGSVVEDFGGQIEGQLTFGDLGFYEQDKKYRCTGCQRTGCVLCGFGAQTESKDDSRFLKLKQTHPKMFALLDIFKNNGVTYRQAIEWYNEHCENEKSKIWI
ncbi:MAG: phosphoadenosine phosphosulfate reductase family protein [Methanobrevibacter sp.]|nr:phosphoadenosine phosphosulfate reductase family protein [Methanobrevibacter sp.]